MINFADPANLVVEEDEPKKVEDGPEGDSSLQLLQTVYRDRKQPLNVRVRCAVEALQHEYPRVSAVAVTNMTGQQSFAEALERAIERSGIKPQPLPPPKVIEHEPPVTAADMKRPFSRYRNNFRRY
jgi:hypothetical protein